ncbi:hypothetical protein FZC74_12045 [Sutcliffiella horikoshii]|uniref:Uncharacterized protein n=1 Tax=Sutcliffiella horikoshii TaxID=79883 RepID=A0AA94WQH0_9BACI|nr:hypothetical protein [Sutcliffiella horikoshii]TYS58531.1 hypothetical protein FZC74_12045 [Sutcliffiella horikoshii]
MKINCTCCRGKLEINDKVVIDELNSVYHADCYSEMELNENLINWKDFGTMAVILEKHNL